ncbi:MAG: hypothetical protein ACNA8K_11830 [Cyclonatronaceae bacterium]
MISGNHNPGSYKYIDLNRLQHMTGNDNELKLILLQKYIVTATRWGTDLFAAMNKSDIEGMRRVLHQMKPHLTMIGSEYLEKMITELHELCHVGVSEMPEIRRITTDFRDLVPEMTRELEREYEGTDG